MARAEGQKLFFLSSMYGLILVIASYVLIHTAMWPIPLVAKIWPSQDLPPNSGYILAPFLLAPIALIIVNGATALYLKQVHKRILKARGCPDPPRTHQWVKQLLARTGRIGNEIEEFLMKTFLDGEKVMLTLDNRKVYVGLLLCDIDRDVDHDCWLAIAPDKSGCRDSETLEVTYTTDYVPLTYYSLQRWLSVVESNRAKERVSAAEGGNSGVLDSISETIKSKMRSLEKQHPHLQNDFNLSDWVQYVPMNRVVSIGPFAWDAALFPSISKKVRNKGELSPESK